MPIGAVDKLGFEIAAIEAIETAVESVDVEEQEKLKKQLIILLNDPEVQASIYRAVNRENVRRKIIAKTYK